MIVYDQAGGFESMVNPRPKWGLNMVESMVES